MIPAGAGERGRKMEKINFLGYRMIPSDLERHCVGTYARLDEVIKEQRRTLKDVQAYEASTRVDGTTLLLTVIRNLMCEEGRKALENKGFIKKGEAIDTKNYLYNTDSWNEGFRLTVQKRLGTVRPGVEVTLYTSGEMYTKIWGGEEDEQKTR